MNLQIAQRLASAGWLKAGGWTPPKACSVLHGAVDAGCQTSLGLWAGTLTRGLGFFTRRAGAQGQHPRSKTEGTLPVLTSSHRSHSIMHATLYLLETSHKAGPHSRGHESRLHLLMADIKFTWGAFKNAHPDQLNQNLWGDSSAPKYIL